MNKNQMVREIGRRTRLTNREVRAVVEALVDVWTEELVSGGKIEIEHFLVLETQTIDRGENAGTLRGKDAPRFVRRVMLRVSKKLKTMLNQNINYD